MQLALENRYQRAGDGDANLLEQPSESKKLLSPVKKPGPAAATQAGVGFTLWQRGAQEFHSYGSGGMVLGKVDAKEDFRLGLAELGTRYCYGFSEHWALVASLRQQFYFDPEDFFTATLLAIGANYVF